MECHQTEQSNKGCSVAGYTYPKRAFTAILLWAGEILQDFESPKQALINAFNHYVCFSHLLDIALGAELRSKDSVYLRKKQIINLNYTKSHKHPY